jgi:hypothetical protein
MVLVFCPVKGVAIPWASMFTWPLQNLKRSTISSSGAAFEIKPSGNLKRTSSLCPLQNMQLPLLAVSMMMVYIMHMAKTC